jgi:anhydro-N-acetylmuramic acid kinase
MKKLEIPSPKKSMLCCGIMTGTSVDGIDIAIVRFTDEENKHEQEVLAFECYPFLEETISAIESAIKNKSTTKDISWLNFHLSEIYTRAFKKICKHHSIDTNDVYLIGVHGQTVWHETNGESSSTLQLCNLSALAKKTNCLVVGDFRSGDVALGGEGAPLVPIYDSAFLRDIERDVIALNIGGIANITYLSKFDYKNIVAFDTGAGNTWIDLTSRKYFNKKYDKNGEIARRGKIDDELLAQLKEIEFIHKLPPKSTGRELFSEEYLNNNIGDCAGEDLISTLTEFTAWSIAENIKMISATDSIIYASGGGVENSYLMERLRNYLSEAEFRDINSLGINPDAKEAICFAYLGFRTLRGLDSNIPSVSGASKSTILGTIALP